MFLDWLHWTTRKCLVLGQKFHGAAGFAQFRLCLSFPFPLHTPHVHLCDSRAYIYFSHSNLRISHIESNLTLCIKSKTSSFVCFKITIVLLIVSQSIEWECQRCRNVQKEIFILFFYAENTIVIYIACIMYVFHFYEERLAPAVVSVDKA